MKDSIFAKMVSGEIPCHKVYEDEKTLAFLDIYPKLEGHVLIIPKVNPTEFVWDLDEDTYQSVMETSKKVALRLREVFGVKYVHQTIIGTDVPYAHVHIMPFSSPEELHIKQDMSLEPDHEQLAKLAEQLWFQ